MNAYFSYCLTPTSALSVPRSLPTRLIVRAARRQDLDALAMLLADSFHSRQGWVGLLHPIFKLGIYEDLRGRLNNTSPHQVCLAAIAHSAEGEAIAGTVEMSASNSYSLFLGRERSVYLSNLAVGESYRRRGVGSKLLRSCEQIARQWGFQEICLHVLETNSAARQLYISSGYQLRRVELGLNTFLLGQSRKMLMVKRLSDRE